jgi:hypothetical protein
MGQAKRAADIEHELLSFSVLMNQKKGETGP